MARTLPHPHFSLTFPNYHGKCLADLEDSHIFNCNVRICRPNPASMYQLQQAALRGQYQLPAVSSSAFGGFGRSPLMSHPSLSGHTPFPHHSFLPCKFTRGLGRSNLNPNSHIFFSTAHSGSSANSSLMNSFVNGAGSSSSGANGASKSSASRSSNGNGLAHTPNGSLAHLLSNGNSNGSSGIISIKQEHSPHSGSGSAGHRQLSANSPSANNNNGSSNHSHNHNNNNNNPNMSNKNRGNSNNDFSDNSSNGSIKLGKSNHSHSRSQSTSSNGTAERDSSAASKHGHIKKPLNAFMIYMKEMRANVIAESTLKESAAINQILGKKVSWLGWLHDQSVHFFP